MTDEEFEVRYKQYIKKSEYYRRKADKLYEQWFYEKNKDNKFLNRIGVFVEGENK